MSRMLLVTRYFVLSIIVSLFGAASLDAQSCCTGTRGNVDLSPDDQIDIADLTLLIDHMFISLADLPCPAEANLDASPGETLDIVDLQILIDFLFISFTPPPACPGGALTYEQREIAMNAVSSLYDSLQGSDELTIAQQLLARIQSRPEFEASGISDSTSVWARFTDGRLYIIPNNRPPDLGEFNQPMPPIKPQSPVGIVTERAPQGERVFRNLTGSEKELPGSQQVRLVNAMGSCYFDITPPLKQMFQKANYAVILSTATIAELKNVSGDGFFYMQAHGGTGRLRDTNTQGDQIEQYCFWTSEEVTAVKESLYAPMLNAGELAVMEAQGSGAGGCQTVRHYCITPKFVDAYMSFGQNSCVYINACGSSKAEMSALFGLNGASHYLGWTKSVSGRYVALSVAHFVDRMLGTNMNMTFGTGVGIQPEDPPQRGFPIQPVLDDLTRLAYDSEPQTGAKLIKDNLGGEFGLLAPSIKFCTVREYEDRSELIIAGAFGSRPQGNDGRVTINENPLTILDWNDSVITCQLPVTGSNASGTVKVGVRRSEGDNVPLVFIESNEVNVSEWNGDFTYTHDDAVDAELKIKLRFRTDIHDFREKPHETPWKTKIIFQPTNDVTGTAKFFSDAVEVISVCTFTLNVNSQFNMFNPFGLGNGQPASGFTYHGWMDMQDNMLELFVSLSASYTDGTYTMSGPPKFCPGAGTYPHIGGVGSLYDDCLYDSFSSLGLNQLEIPLDSDKSVNAGSRECASVAPICFMFDCDGTARFTWTTMPVIHPPHPDHAR